MSVNGALVGEGEGGGPLPLNSLERILSVYDGLSFQLLCGSGFPGASAAYASPSGTVYLTNYRFVYISADQSGWFKTFACTFNRLKQLKLVPGIWPFSVAHVQANVDPMEGEPHLKQISRLTIAGFKGSAADFMERLQSLLFTGPIDPEQYAEPLPRYQSPPPPYDRLDLGARQTK